jgi:hypothetical protein
MQRISGQKIFAGVVVVSVVATVAYGIFLAGAPSLERQRKLDDQRLQHLQQINSAVNQYYSEKKVLPENLSFLLNRPTAYFESVVDPETQAPYEYYLQDAVDGTYTLCAVFAAATSDNPDERMMYRAWAHPAGKYCFSLSAKTGFIVGLDPVRTPSKPCVGNCAEPAVPEPTPVQEGDLRDIPKVCSLMRSKSDGSMHCVACLATDSHACPDAAMDWEFYDTTATPGRVGIPYGCFMTETGCALAQ